MTVSFRAAGSVRMLFFQEQVVFGEETHSLLNAWREFRCPQVYESSISDGVLVGSLVFGDS